MLKDLFRAIMMGELLDWVARPISRRFGYLARSYKSRYYYGLAAIFIVVIAANSGLQAYRSEVKSQSLDLAIRARLSSPKPDEKIIILDIDERSLALLAPEHGRWPWARSVLAEAIATINDAGARSIIFNIMMSDADKTNPQADEIFNEIASTTSNVTYPLIRLNPKNDAESDVIVRMLPNARISNQQANESHIAVLFPYFTGTHDKLGVNNLMVDKDGVVRRYAVWLSEKGYALPSIALQGARIGASDKQPPDEFIINWRNKNGDYKRVSFADYYLAVNGKSDFSLDIFKGATVVIGVSAPGVATTKGTASSSLLDDNVIIATAIDDIINDTHLRVLPAWLIGLCSSTIIIILARSFTKGIRDKSINRWFGLAQSTLVVITIGSASYTVYLADFSQSFLFALFYFVIAKLHASIERNASRGMPSFAEIKFDPQHINQFIIFGYNRKRLLPETVSKAKIEFERMFGVRQLFVVDNAFGDENLFGSICKNLNFIVIFCNSGESGLAFPSSKQAKELFDSLTMDCDPKPATYVGTISNDQASDRTALERLVGRGILGLADSLLSD